MSEQERLRLEEQEEDVLRELRLFLRNVTERLMLDRRFKAFIKPVDIEEVPDYLLVIRKPMDLSTLLGNIDEQKYVTVSEFVADADLIWQNALEYNPDSDPLDRHIRHRACALKDTMRAIVRDELDEDFARVCEEIRASRLQRARQKKPYRKARKSKWSNGVIRKPKKKKPPASASNTSSSTSSKANSDSSAEEIEGVKTRATSGSSGLSSSSVSDSSDEEPSRRLVNAATGARSDVTNGFSQPKLLQLAQRTRKHKPNLRPRTRSSEAAPASRRAHLNKLETRRKADRGNLAAPGQIQMFSRDKSAEASADKTSPLVADHKKLKELLNRAVAKTEGAEVEPLEKLYALLAQCIYRHRNNYNKTELMKEMKSAIDSFS